MCSKKLKFRSNFSVQSYAYYSSKDNKTVNNTGSCFGFRVPVCGFRVPVVCNASLFCVMRRRITQHVWGRGWAHYEKSGALQKKVMHYKKLVPETRKLVPETTNKNHCYCRPQGQLTVLFTKPRDSRLQGRTFYHTLMPFHSRTMNSKPMDAKSQSPWPFHILNSLFASMEWVRL